LVGGRRGGWIRITVKKCVFPVGRQKRQEFFRWYGATTRVLNVTAFVVSAVSNSAEKPGDCRKRVRVSGNARFRPAETALIPDALSRKIPSQPETP
jgi:hypothetical protein